MAISYDEGNDSRSITLSDKPVSQDESHC